MIPISPESLTKIIRDNEYKVHPSLDDLSLLARARVDILYWLLQGGQKRTFLQIANKIQRIKEEMFAYQPNSMDYKTRQEMINTLMSFFDKDLT